MFYIAFGWGRADIGSGWKFAPCEPRPLRDALSTALYTMREHPDAFWGMKYRMIRQDFSWWRAAGDYEKIFQAAMRSPATSVELVAGPLEAVC
jgi:glycogen synthase